MCLRGVYFLIGILGLLVVSGATGQQGCTPPNNGTLTCVDVIPRTIPYKTHSVLLKVFSWSFSISENTFKDETWREIKNLEIDRPLGATYVYVYDHSFRYLVKLEVLVINCPTCFLHSGTSLFKGLDSLVELDLSDSRQLPLTALISSNSSSNVLPKLKRLILARSGTDVHNGFTLNGNFWRFIGSRDVTHLDISFMKVHDSIDLDAFLKNCNSLVEIKMRGTMFETSVLRVFRTYKVSMETPRCTRLQYFDVSDSQDVKICKWFQIFSKFAAPLRLFSKNLTTLNFIKWAMGQFRMFSSITTLKANRMCSQVEPLRFVNFRNITLDSFLWRMKHLHLDGNKFQHLDIEIACNHSSMESISLRKNGLEYLNPNFLACMHTLSHMDLSDNSLDEMVTKNRSLFSQVFRVLYNLQVIHLARNRLTSLPETLFSNNTYLHTLDLSGNFLTHFNLDLSNMKQLVLLDLSDNWFETFDPAFMSNVNMLRPVVKVSIGRNSHLLCSDCAAHYDFIVWVVRNDRFGISISDGVTCTREAGLTVDVNEALVAQLEDKCRPIYPGFLGGSVAIVLVVLFAWRLKIYVQKMKRKRRIDLNKLLINDGQGRYEFVVFLAFCCENEAFVHQQVVHPFQESLEHVTGARRELVCVGDTDVTPGELLLGGLALLMERSNVVIVILTKELCRDVMRTVEFHAVCLENKPVVFMVKGSVTEADMPPLLRNVYNSKRAVKFFWRENVPGEYTLTTTWDHVSMKVLEMVR